MNKKLLLLTSLMVIALPSCGKSNGPKEDNSFEFVTSSVSINTGDYYSLAFKNSNDMDLSGVTYSTSNEEIASVDMYGRVFAGLEGTATISATDGENTATCEFKVTLGEYVPVIEFTDIAEDTIDICVGDIYNLSAMVRCNGSSFSFVPQYEFTTNNGVLTLNENNIIANKTGTEEVVLSGKFGNYDLDPVYLTVNVRNSVQIVLSNENIEMDNVQLSTTSSFGGEDYIVEFTPTFKVFENGVSKTNFTVSVINNEENCVTFDTNTNKITAVTGGNCAYKVSYTSSDGTVCEKTFPISVNRPITNFGDTVFELDLSTGEIPTDIIFAGREEKEVKSVTSLDGSIEYDVSHGLVTDLEDTHEQVNQYVVYARDVGFIINAKVYSKIIKKASDLDVFQWGETYQTQATPEAKACRYPGTYILANDIDASGYSHNPHVRATGGSVAEYSNTGLTGVFDGRGHTISNATFSSGGLFGMIYGGTVKNVGFINITTKNLAHNYEDHYVLASYISGAIIKDVYMNVSNWTNQGFCSATMAHDIANSSHLENILINIVDFPKMEQIKTGSLCSTMTQGIKGNVSPDLCKDVYVVSKKELCHGQNPIGGAEFFVDAENRPNAKLSGTIKNVKRYDTVNDMINANNDYSSFSSDYWEIVSGMLTFKTK